MLSQSIRSGVKEIINHQPKTLIDGYLSLSTNNRKIIANKFGQNPLDSGNIRKSNEIFESLVQKPETNPFKKWAIRTVSAIETAKLKCLSKNKKDIPVILGRKNDEDMALLRKYLSNKANDGPPYPIYY